LASLFLPPGEISALHLRQRLLPSAGLSMLVRGGTLMRRNNPAPETRIDDKINARAKNAGVSFKSAAC